MLNLDGAHGEGDPINVKANNNIFAELGNTTYNYQDLLSELIDNSLAARIDDEFLTVKITIGMSKNSRPEWLTVFDDASGIRPDRLAEAITPAGTQSSGKLNEHGLGMKQAVAGLGELKYLGTRVAGEECARFIEVFRFGRIRPKLMETTWLHGTEIAIHRLKAIVQWRANFYTRDIVPYLGARYRRFLTPANPRMELTIQMVDSDTQVEGDDADIHTWVVEEVKPIYFSRRTRSNAPEFDHHTFKGPGWEADLVFGYSPEGKQWNELGLPPPKRFHPYEVALSRQGLDVILNDRVILFHQLQGLGLVRASHNNYNTVRGEIILKKGFTTAITKNAVIATDHWTQCLREIYRFLRKGKRDYLTPRRESDPDALPEAALRDRLANWFKTNQAARREDVKTEYAVEGLGGKIDVLADNKEAWEIKRGEANGLDVYQLFAYLDMTDFKKGYLLAKDFKPSAYAAKDHINKKHDVEIVLDRLGTYAINYPLSEEEIDKYP